MKAFFKKAKKNTQIPNPKKKEKLLEFVILILEFAKPYVFNLYP
tara:strand:- start:1203 stop:1334 length:132 start_codon:yes stop_codon:yes gene_type:complete